MYLGLIFLAACGAILALRALSDSVDSAGRYDILRKLGAEEDAVSRSVFRQTGIFFLLPLALAGIHSVFGIKFALNIIALFSTEKVTAGILSALAVILIVYGGYFLITYLCSKDIIKSRTD